MAGYFNDPTKGEQVLGIEAVQFSYQDVERVGNYDLDPVQLNLLRPIYAKTAAYGHFGRAEPEFTWEKTDQVSALRSLK